MEKVSVCCHNCAHCDDYGNCDKPKCIEHSFWELNKKLPKIDLVTEKK